MRTRYHTWIRPRHAPEIEPETFLAWAESDLKGTDMRNRANALANIKRAVHARIDELILQTRVHWAHDWPSRPSRDLRFRVIRKLGLKTGGIVAMLTDSRNVFEHRYRLPSLKRVREHVESGGLWLEKSQGHVRPAIAIEGICAERSWGVKGDSDRCKVVLERFSRPGEVRFFWDAKRKIIDVDLSGNETETMYGDLSWVDLLALQLGDLRRKQSRYPVPSPEVTRLFKRYRGWLARHLAQRSD